MKPYIQTSLLAATIALSLNTAIAQPVVAVDDAWIRATVPEQRATGAFMRLTSKEPAKLVSAASPASSVVEVHEMAMQNDVMKMRQAPAIELPAGSVVDLKPGGYHIMLMQLSHQMKTGDKVPITLTFEDAAKKKSEVTVQAEVRPLNTPAAGTGEHGGKGHQH